MFKIPFWSLTAKQITNSSACLLIVGADAESNVGGSFLRAAQTVGIPAELINQNLAFEGPSWWRKTCWHFLGRRAPRQKFFSLAVLERAQLSATGVVLFTGQVPVEISLLDGLRRQGIRTMIYLTDDPFNPAHRSRRFLRLLPHFDIVFTTRKNNLSDLAGLGLLQLEYMPFAVDPHLFFLPPSTLEQSTKADIFFAGGADADRASMMGMLHKAGLKLSLYGSYWERYPETRWLGLGQCGVAQLRRAAWQSKVSLCLIRRANRDGHCMRTFELPALGSCMLVEDTDEHREIFGHDGEAVVYFDSPAAMVDKAKWLCSQTGERLRLARAAHQRIVEGAHTYADRLRQMISVSPALESQILSRASRYASSKIGETSI